MVSSNRPSKKHITSSRKRSCATLRRTSNNGQFLSSRRNAGRSFRTSILNAGSENDFNTVSVGDSKWNFEDLFQAVDTRSARLIAEVISRRSIA